VCVCARARSRARARARTPTRSAYMLGGINTAGNTTVITDFFAHQEHLLPTLGSLAGPVQRWRELIQHTQQRQRKDCRHFCTCDHTKGGFGSTMHILSLCLVAAAIRNCSLVGEGGAAPWMAGMVSSSMQQSCTKDGRKHGLHCYFLPISTCRDANESIRGLINSHHRSNHPVDMLKYANFTDFAKERIPARIFQLTGLTSELLIMSTARAWVMRPQPVLTEALLYYGHAIEVDPQRAISLHVRHGDKRAFGALSKSSEGWRMSTSGMALWARRVGYTLGAQTVLYMTDDVNVSRTLRASSSVFAPVPCAIECFPTFQVGILGSSHNVRGEVWRREREVRTEARARREEECGPKLFQDEGILMATGVMLAAQSLAFVGAYVSNVAVMVAELVRLVGDALLSNSPHSSRFVF
jgi:hypothetical protein